MPKTKNLLIILTLTTLLTGCSLFGPEETPATQNVNQGTVILGESYLSKDPFSPVAIDQQFLDVVFEPLVDFNEEYQIKPKLAYTFGQLSDTMWEFKIRDNAVFHDGESVTTEHVQKSFEFAKNQDYEHLESIFKSIKNVEAPNQETVVFELTEPDPNFLSKLTEVPIIKDYNRRQLELGLQGTGPYKVQNIEASQIDYEAFPQYWGIQPAVKNLTVKTATRIGDRVKALNEDESILAVTPFSQQYTNTLNNNNLYDIKQEPDLSVNFFLWNDNAVNWKKDSNKLLFLDLLPRNLIEKSLNEHGQSINQFVSPGVIGYTPDIKVVDNDTLTRAAQVERYKLNGKKIRFALPANLKTFGLDLEQDLNRIGLDAESYIIEPQQVFDPEITQGIDLIFIGWKSSRGTSLDFFNNFIRVDSTYNLGGYVNKVASGLLDDAQKARTISAQQDILHVLMKEVVMGKPLGVPLFASTQTIISRKNINVPVRLDGLLLLAEIKPQ